MSSPEIAALSSRDRHLFGPGPKRMLSLDGGGVRGAISIAFLERLEKLIDEIEGRPTLLGDWFDFIGGTSTGAIIAGALALGFRAADVRKFYHTLASQGISSLVLADCRLYVEIRSTKLDCRARFHPRKPHSGHGSPSDRPRCRLQNVSIPAAAGSSQTIRNPSIRDTPSDHSFVGNRALSADQSHPRQRGRSALFRSRVDSRSSRTNRPACSSTARSRLTTILHCNFFFMRRFRNIGCRGRWGPII